MASNFTISSDQKGKAIHLNIYGYFDGTSADELLNAIKWYGKDADRIFIHTDGIQSIHPFGQALFRNKFYSVKSQAARLVFTGKNRKKIMPEKMNLFY